MDGAVIFVLQVETDDRWDVTRCQPAEDSEDFVDLVCLDRFDRDTKELWPACCQKTQYPNNNTSNSIRVAASEKSSDRISGGYVCFSRWTRSLSQGERSSNADSQLCSDPCDDAMDLGESETDRCRVPDAR